VRQEITNGGRLTSRRYLLLSILLGIVVIAVFASRRGVSSPAAKQSGKVTIEKLPVSVAVHTFDPAAPPADMPPLAAGEEAECDSNFTSNVNVKGQPEKHDATHAVVTVTEVKMTLQLAINVWVPEAATQHVIEHEQGHRQIAERYYQTADKVGEQIAAKFLGKEVPVSGADLKAEAGKLLEQMSAEITAEYNVALNADRAQRRYDDITDHSRNDVSADDAVAQALQDGQQ